MQSGDESVGIGLFLDSRICCYICLALINVTGMFHPQVWKGLSMSFKLGGAGPHARTPSSPSGLVSGTHVSPEYSAL